MKTQFKIDDKLGLGHDNQVILYCVIERIDATEYEAYVVNGGYEIFIDRTTLETTFLLKHGERIPCPGSYPVFTDNIPKKIAGDYNAAIQYMQEQLDKKEAK